jgi:hypothetical protein
VTARRCCTCSRETSAAAPHLLCGVSAAFCATCDSCVKRTRSFNGSACALHRCAAPACPRVALCADCLFVGALSDVASRSCRLSRGRDGGHADRIVRRYPRVTRPDPPGRAVGWRVEVHTVKSVVCLCARRARGLSESEVSVRSCLCGQRNGRSRPTGSPDTQSSRRSNFAVLPPDADLHSVRETQQPAPRLSWSLDLRTPQSAVSEWRISRGGEPNRPHAAAAAPKPARPPSSVCGHAAWYETGHRGSRRLAAAG